MPMSLSTIASTVSPDLIAATVAAIPPVAIEQSNQLHTIIATACSTASSQDEALALLIRMRAAAILFRDKQWLDCISRIRTNASCQLAMKDGIILELIATQPLDASLHFDTDDFCNAMRDRIDARRLN
jgi:hypothetical protein